MKKDKTVFKYSCPVCNSPNQITFEGMGDICYICGWEDNSLERTSPDEDWMNPVSLNKARKMWSNGETLYPDYPNPKKNAKKP